MLIGMRWYLSVLVLFVCSCSDRHPGEAKEHSSETRVYSPEELDILKQHEKKRLAKDFEQKLEKAKSGSPSYQLTVADCYSSGYSSGKCGVPADDGEAVQWYRRAADQGVASAQFDLGLKYSTGGVHLAKDSRESAKWFRRFLENGDGDATQRATAQSEIGSFYLSGEGVPQDFSEAAKWFRLAAAQGDAFAQYCLGMIYAKGWGVKRDPIHAHMWFSLACTGNEIPGYQDACGERERLSRSMTPEQIARAHGLASNWKPGSH